MITDTGYNKYCIWEHSSQVMDLYARRCRQECEEMTSHAQAVDIMKPFVTPGDSLLDAGCGSGYFFHSLQKQGLDVRYTGIDAAPSLIEIGSSIMPEFGLPAEQLKLMRLEDADGAFDHVVCINVLSNIDNYHRPLERLLQMAQKTLVLRESIADASQYQYVQDKYLDADVCLNVHVNTYGQQELQEFIRSYGFDMEFITDRYTGGEPENVIDYPHYWKFVLARKVS